MRLQLISVAAVVATVGATAMPADADGSLSVRGVYYKERATRVMQPMLDGMFDAGTRGVVTGHFLVDAITSASSSSGADNAVPFTENRIEAGAGYTHDLGRIRIGGEGKYSIESDYRSIYGGIRGELDLAAKNATLGLGLGIARDRISAGSAQGPAMPTLACSETRTATECPMTTLAMFASASQILSRNAIASVTYDVARLDGYQSNPYRTALADDGLAPERHPFERLRQAVAGSVRYHVVQSQTTLIGGYRFYRDNWRINAHTPELRILQEVGSFADAAFRYRYHHQDAAFFYRDRYPTTDAAQFPYISDDVKLDAFASHTLEAKLGIFGESFDLGGRWAGARFETILQYVIQHDRFGNAIIAHAALTVPLDY